MYRMFPICFQSKDVRTSQHAHTFLSSQSQASAGHNSAFSALNISSICIRPAYQWSQDEQSQKPDPAELWLLFFSFVFFFSKILPNRFQNASTIASKSILGASWLPGSIFPRFVRLLGGSWRRPGASWVPTWRQVALQKVVLGATWGILGTSWGCLGASWERHEVSWDGLERLGGVLGRPSDKNMKNKK